MGLPGIQMWTWTLFGCLSWLCVGQVAGEPHYMVAIPAVLEAGADTKFCTSLLEPNETMVMSVTLVSPEMNTLLFQKSFDTDFHDCVQFKVPEVVEQAVLELKVEVRGQTFHSTVVRKVMIKAYQPMTFIQTDKPIYLPGQTVNFRVVSLDTKFRPASELYNIVEVQDVNRNRIGQWVNITSNSKIFQRSYSLNSEAPEGTYQVIVSIGERKIYHSFKVEKYVLPKFDVKITAKDEISIAQDDIEVEVCAKYTYGQPVPGSVEVNACRPLRDHIGIPLIWTPEHPEGVPEFTAPCHKETKPADMKGCATFTFQMSAFTKGQKLLQDTLHFAAKVEEDGTGTIHGQFKTISISYVVGKLSFVDIPTVYQEGSNVTGRVNAFHYNDTPIANTLVYLMEGERWNARVLQNLTTDCEGVASFSLDTADHKTIRLGASLSQSLDHTYREPYVETATHQMSLAQPPSPDVKTASQLVVNQKDKALPCGGEETVSIKFTVVGEVEGPVPLMYLLLSRGAVVMQGHETVQVDGEPVTEGEVSFKLIVTPDLAPEFQVVAYAVLPSHTVIAHSADFSTEKCFSHKVSVDFSPSSAMPGEENTLKVTAHPNSLCGVSAVDKSVLIKAPGQTLDADKVFNLLPVTKHTFIPYEAEDPVSCLPVRTRRYIMPYPGHGDKDDAFTVFQNVGLKIATNLFIRVPSCVKFRGREYHYSRYHHRFGVKYMSEPQVHSMARLGMAAAPGAPPNALPPMMTVRTFFPETWIWDLVEVGATGVKDVALKVPDTITTWETEAFCLSPQGFGLAPRKELKVFQHFFLQLTLPYSIVRGEQFELKATVFNYMSSCIMVTVTAAPSLDYTLTPLSGDLYTSCLCANERKTLSWTMSPTSLGAVDVSVSAEAVASHASCDNEIVSVPERGQIDKVTRPLIVKAEGTEVTKAYNLLLCPKGGALSEEVEVQLPENVILGSAVASVSVLGDILGRALKNLDGLLRMPYGCGEQNMALLAPNIYILQYLKHTQQLSTAIKKKAFNFLTSGYQRQLNYKHSNGAYSTFGTGDGNTWLTAFVLRSFVKAQSFVYIDPSNIEETKTWLEGKQQPNGCFEQSGKLFNNRMKGGVSDEVTLSAYITAAFLEINSSAVNDDVVKHSLSCLKESLSNLTNTYTTALLAYVFTLAGDMPARAELLGRLEKVSIQQGGFLHWTQTASETSASLSVEISSYVLLAKLGASPTAEDLGYGGGIVRWLSNQQNYYGGFSSTQDTVVALQALALYSTLVFSPDGSSTVTVQSPSEQLTFEVNQGNKLLYQEEMLKETTGKYNMEVKGNTCASMQISLRYNIPTPAEKTTLSVTVKPAADCNSTDSVRPKVTLRLQSLYEGKEETTNMVILDIKLLSGFVPVPESLRKLRGALLVDRVEEKEDHILMYIQELPTGMAINHSLELMQEVPVQKLKSAVVKIYDYYQPSDESETEYIFPCARD
ncbi:alpha-2-macroglobulin-like [Genypterus blacodes]|uniref:alpha-2-macroglobulin-like n=1 Tax=Genypterus blacodes TaxID=154954 RepID=UPI003F77478D